MSEKKQSIWEAYKFSILLIGAILIGSLIGIHFGEAAVKLKPLGDLFINGMFMIVVPLVFITISSSIAGMNDMNRLGKIMKNLFLIFIGTGVVAFFYVFVVVKIFPPAAGVALEMPAAEALKPFQTGDQIVKAITVTDFPELISRKNMLPLIIFSIVFGICVNMIGEKGRPIGLGAYFAALVGEHGKELLGSYARAIAVYYPLCLVYMFTAFPVYGYIAAGKEGIRALKHVISPAITAVATQSSIATLPVNLEACKKIGVPKDIREIVLPIGATAHMDGTVLSTILKISFLFGIFQIPFEGMGTYLSALALSVVGGVVMSGVPGGGLIGEMLIVTMYGFPAEAFPIIATIGYLVDPFATMINASGDTMASMLVTRAVEGKDWIKRNLGND